MHDWIFNVRHGGACRTGVAGFTDLFLRRWMLAVESPEFPLACCNAAAVCKNVAFVCINAGAACENAGGVLMVGALRAGMDAGPGVTFRGCRRHASRCGCRRACDGSGPVGAGRGCRCKWGERL